MFIHRFALIHVDTSKKSNKQTIIPQVLIGKSMNFPLMSRITDWENHELPINACPQLLSGEVMALH
jgi:hypothetical protein